MRGSQLHWLLICGAICVTFAEVAPDTFNGDGGDEAEDSGAEGGGSSTLLILAMLVVVGFVSLKAMGGGGAKVAGGGSKGDSILLLGHTGAGKTVLLHRMLHGDLVDTVPSMKHAQHEVSCGAGEEASKVNVIDFPGHRRLRGSLPGFLQRAKAIVFVVDSAAVAEDVTAVAEFLYEVLTDATAQATRPPVLFACNKQDERLAKAPEKIRSMLEKEMSEQKTTRASMQDTSDDTAETLGREGEDFEFDEDSPCAVSFVPCSARDAKVEGVMEFIGAQA